MSHFEALRVKEALEFFIRKPCQIYKVSWGWIVRSRDGSYAYNFLENFISDWGFVGDL